MPEPKPLTPAYVPFKTFTSVLDTFTSFLPDRIDTSMWPSYSGGMRSQLLNALKFLRLVEDDGTPTDALKALARTSSEQRGKAFQSVMRTAYPSLMALDLTKATPASFDAEIRKFGQEGEVHRKAASFFLQAAKWAAVPLSPLLLKKGSLAGTRRKRLSGNGAAKLKTGATGFVMKIPNSSLERPAVGSTKQIVLSGGVTVSLSTDIDLFRMTSEDRRFVMSLLDLMEAHEAQIENDDEEENETEN